MQTSSPENNRITVLVSFETELMLSEWPTSQYHCRMFYNKRFHDSTKVRPGERLTVGIYYFASGSLGKFIDF